MGRDKRFQAAELFQRRRIVSQSPLQFVELRLERLCSAVILIQMGLLTRNGISPRAAFRRVQATRQRVQGSEHLLRSIDGSMGGLFVDDVVAYATAYTDQSVQ